MSEYLSETHTLPQLLLKNRDLRGFGSVALRAKEYGIWKEYRWSDCYQKTKAIFFGLRSVGLRRGTRVCILGRNSLEWLLCEIAVQAARGVLSGVDEKLSPDDTGKLMGTFETELVLAEGQETVNKLLAVKGRLPEIRKIMYWRAKGVESYTDPVLMSLDELTRAGMEYGGAHPRDFEDSVTGVRKDDVAIELLMLTGDRVRSVPVTHDFLVSFAETASADIPALGKEPPDYVAANPAHWFYEQGLGYARCLLKGQILNFPESTETAESDFREISPQVVVRRPEAWERTSASINRNLRNSTPLKRAVSAYGFSMGYRVACSARNDGRAGILGRLIYKGADAVVFGPLRDKHGLNRAKLAYVIGGAASDETRRLFRVMNIDLREVYCSTKEGLVTTDPGEESGLH